jgi:energy-coupling factor transporter ATP-binding protein EcfA2
MSDERSNQRIHQVLVTRIEVEKLFGRYNYVIGTPRGNSGTISRIALIYGDNGTGKTTILKLLFHLISPNGNRGHRGFLCRTPFSRFAVMFSDGTGVEAARNGLNLTGPFELAFTRGNKTVRGDVKPDPDGRVTSSGLSASAEQAINELNTLGLSVFLLGDDRVLQSDQFEDDAGDLRDFERRHYDDRAVSEILRRRVRSAAADNRGYALRQSLRRATEWISRHSIEASSRGESEAQQIYANIVEEINRAGLPRADAYKAEKEKLIDELRELDERSSSYARLGLIPRITAARFIRSINETGTKGLPFISQVIRSFVDGQRARLDSLDDLYVILNRFLVLINGFLRDKHIVIDTSRGISIMIDPGAKLDPENLSSGEKQLLLLFLNVLTSTETASLFIIDEPEISLNVKWQRKLVDSLIDITAESSCQFLLATHSIELLTKHRGETIKLVGRRD